MNEIAAAAGTSRAALYLAFENKEDAFIGVFLQWIEETIVDIERDLARAETPGEKLAGAFELGAGRPFETAMQSAEAKELLECRFEFAQAALRRATRGLKPPSFRF